MSREPALYPFGMKIASTARQLPGRKTKDEEYGRNEAFSNRRSSYTFDLPLAENSEPESWSVDVPLWTKEEGRSDLTLEVTMTESGRDLMDVEIDDIHVK